MEVKRGCQHTLLLHIGTPKTGTTSLQNFLLKNRQNLISDGWDYPDFVSELPELYDNSNFVRYVNGSGLRVAYQNLVEKGNADAREKWDALIECILSHLEKNNVIISAEAFWLIDLEDFITRLHNCYENVSVIVYLRRQDKFIESQWNQYVKVLFETRTIEEYSETTGREICRYLDRLNTIQKIIGKNLIVRVFEKQFFRGGGKDIVSDFLTAIGLDSEESKWEKVECLNDRLSGNYLEIKRIFNSVYNFVYSEGRNGIRFSEYDDLFWNLSREYKKNQADKDEGFFSVEQRKCILDRYAEENEIIARKFLNREDGILFYDLNVLIPVSYNHANLFEEDIIRTFSFLLITQKRQHSILLKMLNGLQKKRLAYFGGGSVCRALLGAYSIKPDIIIDNYAENSLINGIAVILAENVEKWDEYFIVITCRTQEVIESQLQEKGLKKGIDYLCWNEFF